MIIRVSKENILPKPENFQCKVERSWSEDVPAKGASAEDEKPIDRSALIKAAVARRQGK